MVLYTKFKLLCKTFINEFVVCLRVGWLVLLSLGEEFYHGLPRKEVLNHVYPGM